MATKKATTKPTTTKKPEALTAVYRGNKYEIIEQNEHKVCLTDGTIHFWVRAKDVEIK
jgi:hypothetical protein